MTRSFPRHQNEELYCGLRRKCRKATVQRECPGGNLWGPDTSVPEGPAMLSTATCSGEDKLVQPGADRDVPWQHPPLPTRRGPTGPAAPEPALTRLQGGGPAPALHLGRRMLPPRAGARAAPLPLRPAGPGCPAPRLSPSPTCTPGRHDTPGIVIQGRRTLVRHHCRDPPSPAQPCSGLGPTRNASWTL